MRLTLARWGMTKDQIGKCRQRQEGFLLDWLEPVGRSERRHGGELDGRGLLQDGEGKSIEPLAARSTKAKSAKTIRLALAFFFWIVKLRAISPW